MGAVLEREREVKNEGREEKRREVKEDRISLLKNLEREREMKNEEFVPK
jgi:hypothetical protein